MIRRKDLPRAIGAPALLSVGLFAVVAAAQDRPLDVDANGEVDAFTDVIYAARYLADLPPVPPTYRALDPSIPPDEEISARIETLVGPRAATRTPTPSFTPTRTPTATPTQTPTRTPTVTRTATITPSATPSATPSRTSSVTPTLTVTATRTPSRTESPTPTVTAPPTPTPQLQGDDSIIAASELAVQNAGMPTRLRWGCAAAVCETSTAQEDFAFATAERQALVKRAAVAGLGGVESCAVDGTRQVVCTDGIERTLYGNCRELTDSGNSVTRDGTVEVSIVGGDICSGAPASPGNTVRIDLVGYRQEERDIGGELLALLEADLRDEFQQGATGCAGPEGTQRVDGSFSYQCRLGTESMPCQGEGEDLTMTLRDLHVVRRAGGVPCELGLTITGAVDVDNRFSGATAAYSQTFDGLVLAEALLDDGRRRVRQDGGTSVDCLGGLVFRTRLVDDQQTGAMVFPQGQACPEDGVLEVTRAPLAESGTFVDGESVDEEALVRRGGVFVPNDIRQQLFRSQNGKVYQLIQNFGSGGSFGAEAVQVTTLVGAEAGSVGQCANAAGATSDPQAVTAAEAGRAFPLSSVFKSGIVPFTTQEPCFSESAVVNDKLDGRVCLGPDCVDGGCSCPAGGDCVAFTLTDGTVLTAGSPGIPAATLVEPLAELDDPCSGFAGRATYRFGQSGPTTSTRQCTEAPADGFRLAAGEAVVFAYDTPLAALFNAGFAGFPVDVDGANTLSGCVRGGETVLHFGRAAFDSVPAPVVTFRDGGVAFNFDGSRGLCIGGSLDGEACQSDTECPDGFCAGICDGGSNAGLACEGNSDCPGGRCLASTDVDEPDCRLQVLAECR